LLKDRSSIAILQNQRHIHGEKDEYKPHIINCYQHAA